MQILELLSQNFGFSRSGLGPWSLHMNNHLPRGSDEPEVTRPNPKESLGQWVRNLWGPGTYLGTSYHTHSLVYINER
jgi:hypothetical protein